MDPISGNSNATEQTISLTEALHKRFHSLVTLIQLVSAVNESGYPTLRAFSRKNNPGGPLDDSRFQVPVLLWCKVGMRTPWVSQAL
ncbi:hypothetical protein PILCRDRAFT_810795 [Piloderma croceum F 1598]|uniref:Uncharacterized protein n=1 Tax=Piloderma croceum (strain F 1598) TaxID=765440 RepID=A0A0C3BY82_PILCF|nr:hypothetical protein PILCRDRAFT_810795 [Piloderma croceum F 1598]